MHTTLVWNDAGNRGIACERGTALNVLIVEDSARLRDSLGRGLTASGFTVDNAVNGVAACQHLDTYEYELVVLDLGLPGMDGFGVLRHIQGHTTRPRVLVLSARDQIADRVDALNRGADDYLVKPFAFDELVARLHALARRSQDAQTPQLIIGTLTLDPAGRTVRVQDQWLTLTPREFSLLELLMRHRGRAFSRSDILERLAGCESTASDRSVEVLVFGLRRKLEQAGISELVHTRRGFGYLIPKS
ncbi:response regulator transcription factor [Dyella nitratireducens]|uniref:DNA-binding response regulator n=1 Tax=Dyella nitratireducens TaxID=1849580 RepID=A0ABQ1FTC6_9GAMM|nr:response regulator transcription factor [Dyella nitratireducens]GGA30097.1 DNA-binding response regulator [Dyella nitratireducens]GLQ43051.1 DNA-binding response regulator [Dyella nitratireducens]